MLSHVYKLIGFVLIAGGHLSCSPSVLEEQCRIQQEKYQSFPARRHLLESIHKAFDLIVQHYPATSDYVRIAIYPRLVALCDRYPAHYQSPIPHEIRSYRRMLTQELADYRVYTKMLAHQMNEADRIVMQAMIDILSLCAEGPGLGLIAGSRVALVDEALDVVYYRPCEFVEEYPELTALLAGVIVVSGVALWYMRAPHEDPPCSSIENQGNSCYVAAALQFLAHSDLSNIISTANDAPSASAANTPSIAQGLRDIALAVQRPDHYEALITHLQEQFSRAFGFRDYCAQHDTVEFIQWLLGQSMGTSHACLRALFQLVTQLHYVDEQGNPLACINCLQFRDNVVPKAPGPQESDLQLTLALPADGTTGILFLQDLIKDYFSRGQIDQVRCQEQLHDHHDAFTERRILEFPHHLMIQLRRFSYDRHASKITRGVDIPFDNLSLNEQSDTRYKLSAIICHHGRRASSGHYTALVRRGDVWYEADDAHSRIITIDQMKDRMHRGLPYFILYTRHEDQQGCSSF